MIVRKNIMRFFRNSTIRHSGEGDCVIIVESAINTVMPACDLQVTKAGI